MSWNDTDLLLLQEDAHARLENEPFFADIKVMLRRDGVTADDVAREIGPNQKKAGKTGACAIVLMPVFLKPEGESPGPVLRTRLSVQVIESRQFNNLASVGTRKSAEQIATNVLNLLHLYTPFHIGQTLTAGENPLTPVDIEDNADWVSYRADLELHIGLTRTDKVANPDVSIALGLITLTCATPGAAIYYTLDQSYPGAANSNAVLYAGPFDPGAATVLRAVAYKSDSIPSDSIVSLLG
jgi:hypothetical protein